MIHKSTKATSIPKSVKDAVYIRDGGMCVICKRPGLPNAHVVRRSHMGKGIEQNIVCLCPTCHRGFDSGTTRERETFYVAIVAHLKGFYPDWDKSDMVYKKGDA